MPRLLCTALLLALVLVMPARAQSSFSIGPQVSTLGIGVSGSYRLTPRLSVSAEANLVPTRTVDYEVDDIDYDADVRVRGSVVMLNVHPFGGRFSLGAGVFFGGYEIEGVATPTGPVEVGDETYAPEEIGEIAGFGSAGGPIPIVGLGWRGRGFNFGVGVTTGYALEVDLEARGPNANRQDVRDSLEEERQNVEDDIRQIPVIPYLRLGWQFGL